MCSIRAAKPLARGSNLNQTCYFFYDFSFFHKFLGLGLVLGLGLGLVLVFITFLDNIATSSKLWSQPIDHLRSRIRDHSIGLQLIIVTYNE